MKPKTFGHNASIGLLFAMTMFLSLAQATQQREPEPAKVVRKAGGALQASAINRVDVVYPPQALVARVFGTVIVEVSIDENGTVSSARAVSGHPLLQGAAVDAARGWTFKATTVEGKAVKVIGTLSFSFKLPDYMVRDRLIERLKQRLAENPQNAKLHYQLGRAYEDNQKDAEALKSYGRAISLTPNYGDAQVALGNLHMKLNHNNEALVAYNHAVRLELNPETKAAAYRGMALIYLRRDQFKEAVEPFKHAIALAPQGSMYLNLGLTYLKLGDKQSAMEQYRLLKDRNSILAQQLLKQINEAR